MRAERIGADTLLAQIVKMVSEAQRSRAPIQRLADRVAAYFVPAVIGSAIITFARLVLCWATAALRTCTRECGGRADRRLPCALGLATPMAIMVGTGREREQAF